MPNKFSDIIEFEMGSLAPGDIPILANNTYEALTRDFESVGILRGDYVILYIHDSYDKRTMKYGNKDLCAFHHPRQVSRSHYLRNPNALPIRMFNSNIASKFRRLIGSGAAHNMGYKPEADNIVASLIGQAYMMDADKHLLTSVKIGHAMTGGYDEEDGVLHLFSDGSGSKPGFSAYSTIGDNSHTYLGAFTFDAVSAALAEGMRSGNTDSTRGTIKFIGNTSVRVRGTLTGDDWLRMPSGSVFAPFAYDALEHLTKDDKAAQKEIANKSAADAAADFLSM